MSKCWQNADGHHCRCSPCFLLETGRCTGVQSGWAVAFLHWMLLGRMAEHANGRRRSLTQRRRWPVADGHWNSTRSLLTTGTATSLQSRSELPTKLSYHGDANGLHTISFRVEDPSDPRLLMAPPAGELNDAARCPDSVVRFDPVRGCGGIRAVLKLY